ncbi:NAD(P)H dehydrogenase [Proteiniclasticum sp.]|uniref:NAD(P)H dehydrogenase n=1 Tax=Proteiniclasticum sp. TaxID=2053595 RepID=UPI002896717C|nr:NAD(P)H dehydrogenase [Proteiniclasticum sp.]
MKMIMINGSPKGDKGNTEIFIREFLKGMETPCEVRYVAKESGRKIAEDLKHYDTVIMAMPLYVHAMPGIVMKLIEEMKPAEGEGKSMGYIVQSGFIEAAQSKYLERYLCSLTKRLGYDYLGTVIKGGSAGVYMMPEKMNAKLFVKLNSLGSYFEEHRSFRKDIVEELGTPYSLTKKKSRWMQFYFKVGLGDSMFWRMLLRSNHASDKKFDRPFAE